ncbi:rhamnan synthesis F family protein [Lactococcus insecticola]|uniref:Alpha-L-Rha alpha-1,3-L-rhamnosyltransferase n=1 Tax=Pseudolactococcus insecticola TaxID=2709158 RepID=A0A6A0B6C4_9LACT|nr:rhamnan synthesis F family protein [Lactococcus insecticola]GFH40999.1 hypothetical protein Hs20B_13970 [Lactococcus insecticola]
MNRILLYVHFNKFSQVADHVVYQLEQLRPLFSKVVFISNSPVSVENQKRLKELGLFDVFMQRENKGYDFAAWHDAMVSIGFEELKQYDAVTIMNDTAFGPVYDFGPVFDKMAQNASVDFWGITNNRSHTVAPWGEDIVLPDHIQSYFVTYKQNVVVSEAFKSFWSGIEVLEDVVKVIVKYETAMTKHFEDAGFKSAVLFDTRKESWAGMTIHDFSVFALPELIKREIPFLKIKAFSFGAKAIQTPVVIDMLRRNSDYPIKLIVDHMTFVDYPDREYMLDEKILQMKEVTRTEKTVRVGIHLHVFYVDLLAEFLANFDQYIGDYDVFVTTDTEAKKEAIQKVGHPHVKEIVVAGNKGRDVLPWMMVHDKLADYDVAGHFHTKKSAVNEWIVGESWRQDIIDSLVKPAKQILAEFDETKSVGLVIADVPSFFNHWYGPSYINEHKLWKKMLKIWQVAGLDKKKALEEKDTYTMSYGTMLWYRPDAISDLLTIDISEETPNEPLPYDSILHAFERIIVYAAWANGYDFRISKIHQSNGFVANSAANRLLRDQGYEITNYEGLNTSINWEQLGAKRALKYLVKKSLLIALSIPKRIVHFFRK